jgi:putative FmdB family regulatory protein
MPIFEYRCRECGAQFEKIVRSAAEHVICESCQSKKVEQLLSVFTVSAASGSTGASTTVEAGPCPCGAPRRGMCED